MLKVAILDDYQNIAKDFIDLKKLSSKYEFQVFNEPFENEDDAIEKLKEFEVLFIMRERTKITKNLISCPFAPFTFPAIHFLARTDDGHQH